jgi:putative ABC transport system permease protein
MLRDYVLFSYRSLRKRKLRSYLTMIGIFIGVAAVISLISLATGMQTAIKAQFASFGADAVTIEAGGVGGFGPPGSGAVEPLLLDDVQVIESVNEVDGVVSRLIRSVKVEFNDETEFTFATSVPEKKESIDIILELNDYKIDQGRFLKSSDSNKIVLGSDFTKKTLFGKALKTRDKILIEGEQYEVVGVLKKKGNPQQDSIIIMMEDSLRNLVNEENDVVDIVVARVAEGIAPSVAADEISEALRKDRHLDEGEEDFKVQTTEQVISSLNTILAVVQGVLIGIAAISLVVGGIGIMNTMYTSVLERTKEIGIMKAIGAKNKDIGFLFLIESGMLGLTGGGIGVLIGASMSKLVEIAATSQLGTGLLQAEITFPLVLGALAFSFIIGALSGIFPALQAAHLKPVEALRKK